jgi:acid phosphatase family membrane protein YuiD
VPSRELSYKVTGDVRDFHRALQSVDRQLDTSEKRAHHFGSGLASAFKGVGSAAGLAGAAIAGGLVLEAKRSVVAFQESNKVAKQTQAVLKSTGGAANVTAKEISNLATALSRKTGVDDEAIQSAENLIATFTNVRNEAGKGNDIFNRTTKSALDMSVALGTDAKTAAMQLAKALNDPAAGMTKLMRSGVSFTQQQKDQVAALQKSGHTLEAQKIILREVNKEFAGSAKAQATSTDKMKVAFGNLEEDLGSGLAPAVDNVAGKLTKFAIDVEPKVIKAADRIAKTFGRKDLSLDQKFRISYDKAQNVFKPLVDEAKASIGKMDLGHKLGDAIEKATPIIADSFAKAAPKAAGRFIHAFTNANVWGQLLIGGLLLKKMGGLGAFAALGRKAGGSFAAGMAEGGAAGGGAGAAAGAAGGVGAGAALSRIPASLKVAGGAAGGIAALKIGSDFIRGYAQADAAVKVFSGRVKELTSSGNRQGLKSLATEIRHYADVNQGSFSDSGKAARKYADDVEHALDRANKASTESKRDLAATNRDVSANWGLLESNTKAHLSDIKDAVKANMGVIKQRLGKDSAAGRQAMASNFRQAADAVRQSMKDGAISTKTGTELIRRYLVDALKALGLSDAQATSKVTSGTIQSGARKPGQAMDPGAATGGWIGRRGQAGGDTVPIMVGAGEAVLNRHQQGVVEGLLGNGFLDKLFSNVTRPHYMASGGYVPQPGMAFAAGGKIPRVTVSGSGAVQALSQRSIDIDRSSALTILAKAAAHAASAGVGSSRGPSGVGSFNGVPMANWVVGALRYAQSKGVTVRPTSGYRPGFDPHTASGTSEHQGLQYPHGAVDFGGYHDSAALAMKMAVVGATSSYKYPLLAPAGFVDDGHASGTGHARGGFIRFARGGFTGGGMATIAKAKKTTELDRLKGREAHAKLTKGDADDRAVARDLVSYWEKRVRVERRSGTRTDITTAENALSSARSHLRALKGKQDKPTKLDYLESNVSQAALTPKMKGQQYFQTDDYRAADRLVAYWKHRLAMARKSRDPRKIREAADALASAKEARASLKPEKTDTSGNPSKAYTAYQAAIDHMTLQANAGEFDDPSTPEDETAGVLRQKQIDYAKFAENGGYGKLKADELLAVKGDERTATASDDPNQALIDAHNAHIEALKALTDAQTADTNLRSQIFGTQTGQVMAAIADMVSGQIGGRIGLGIQTPGFAGGGVIR